MKNIRCGSCRENYPADLYLNFLRFLCPSCRSPILLKKNHPEQIHPPLNVSAYLEADTHFGHYYLLDRIDEGGMAVLYQARHEKIGEEYALKILRPNESEALYEEDILRFYNEVQSASKLFHPNIIKIYEAGVINQLHFFSMELLSGYSLADLLDERSTLSEEEAITLGIGIAQALQHSHSCGVFHRDIKPENILFRADMTPVVTDFGLATNLKLDAKLSESGYTLGTPDYMAPEQALSEVSGQGADIYSLGVVLYELVSGSLPHLGETSAEIMDKVVNEAPIPLKTVVEVSEGYHQLVMKCLAKETDHRYPNMKLLEEDLQHLVAGSPLKLGSQKPSKATNLRWVLWGILFFSVAIVAIFFITSYFH